MLGEGGRGLLELERAATLLLVAAPKVPCDGERLLEFLSAFRTQLNRCELAFAGAAAKLIPLYQSGHEYDLSPTQHLRYDCHMASGAAAAAVGIGEHLERLPESSAYLEAGRIGIAHLSLLAQTAEFLGDGFREQPLLRKAEKNHVTAFARICAHARHAANPELFAQEERDLHEARFLELTTRADDGAVFLKGLLDAEGGAYLRTAVENLSQPLPNDDRIAAQRKADALVEIAKVTLDEGRLPERGGVRPHVQVTAPLETLLGWPGAPAAELEGSGPISGEMLRRLAGDCSVRRLLLDENSLVIDVGRERRVFRGAARAAIDHRDGGCVWPGCTRSARFCQADHAQPWFEGGGTDAGNGRLLCRYHHRLRSDGWQLTRTTEDGEPRWLVSPPFWALDRPAG